MIHTVASFAEKLKCHPRTVVRLITSGRLPAMNVGTGRHADFRIDEERAVAALAYMATPPAPSARDEAQLRQVRRRRPRRPNANASPAHQFV